MSCFTCCFHKDTVENDLSESILQNLERIRGTYSEVIFPCVISKEGIVVSTLYVDEVATGDLTLKMASLKQITARFSTVLSVTGCTSIKVAGENHCFHLYVLDSQYLLAFYSLSDPTATEEDLEQKDEITKQIVSEIQQQLLKLTSEN